METTLVRVTRPIIPLPSLAAPWPHNHENSSTHITNQLVLTEAKSKTIQRRTPKWWKRTNLTDERYGAVVGELWKEVTDVRICVFL